MSAAVQAGLALGSARRRRAESSSSYRRCEDEAEALEQEERRKKQEQKRESKQDAFYPLDISSDSTGLIRWSTTFLVLANRLGKVYIFRFNKAPSLWIFGPHNFLRKLVIYLITNQFFEFFIILTILINCVLLALEDTPEEVEYFFTAIYTMEMVLKIIAKGFILHKFAYLRDPWNWLDFIVVTLGYMTLAPNIANLSGIRTFRVFRALRTISAIEGLKTMVNALLKSMRMLGDVLVLTSFFICVFALVGLQLFVGVLHQRCVSNQYINMTRNNHTANWTQVAQAELALNSNGTNVLPYICGNNTRSKLCPSNYTCLGDIGPNPNHGFTHYDHFGWAVLTSFQLVHLDYWENVYEHILSALGPWYVIYFMMVIFFGSFYLINLVLAVVALSYQEETCIKNNLNGDLGVPIYRLSIFQENQYSRLRQVASSYSLHRRIIPKMLYEDPLGNSIAELSCVKNSTNVIILSRNSNGKKYESEMTPYIDEKSVAETHTNNSTLDVVEQRKISNVSDASINVITDSPASNHDNKVSNLEVPAPMATMSFTDCPAIDSESMQIRPTETNVEGCKSNPRTSQEQLQKNNVANRKISTNSATSKTTNLLEVPQQSNGIVSEERVPTQSPADSERKDSKGFIRSMGSRLGTEISAEGNFPPRPYAGYPKHELSCGHKFREKMYSLVTSPWFELAITIFIVLNTVCLAIEHHGMDEDFKHGLNNANHAFTAIFILEMILKLTAFGWRGYVKSRWNIFDGVVVFISIIDVIIEISSTSENGDLSILRSFRLLRVLKLAQSWSTMRMLLNAMGKSLGALGNLILILLIILYMLAIIGVNLFSTQYKAENFPNNKIPVWNFSNFGHSLMMMIRLLCGEWIEPLYDCMLATGPASIIFFIGSLIVGNFLVLNLFLALLLSSFSELQVEEETTKRKRDKSKRKWINSSRKLLKFKKEKKDKELTQSDSESPCLDRISVDEDTACDIEATSLSTVMAGSNRDLADSDKVLKDHEHPPATGPGGEHVANGVANGVVITMDMSPVKQEKSTCCACCVCWACCKKLQARFRSAIEHKYFDNAILVLILFSSFILVFEDINLPSQPQLGLALEYLNLIFCVIFAIEMLVKLFGFGIIGYFRNPWNILDFIIVIVSITSVSLHYTGDAGSLSSLRSLRTLRALRPLRAVSRWEGMKIVVNSLLKAIPSIGNVLVVCMFFWLIFSIMGVQFFGGRFYKCLDDGGQRLDASIVPNKTECIRQGYRWINSKVTFDNTGYGFLALFQVATFEGWMEVMQDAADIVGYDMQPIVDNNFGYYFFFAIFIIFGSFFILNLFISVIIDNFYRLKKQYDDGGSVELFLTDTQKQWFLTVKKALSSKPSRILKRPRHGRRAKLFDLVTSRRFETIIMFMIILNMICMFIHHHHEPVAVTMALRYLNLVFCVIFTIELILRIFALGCQYFKSAWNVFDFIVVLLSYVGLGLDWSEVNAPFSPSILRVARVLRIGRLLRYFTAAKGIRRLLVALIISLPALFNIGALLFLILFIYSIVGMSLFMYVKKQGAINEVVNFETFPSSFIVLFRLSTSAGWNEVLDSLMVKPPDCDPKWNGLSNGNCGNNVGALIFMITFIIITFLIIVNMYIAIILENFNQAHQQEESGVTNEDIEMFYTVWQHYDPAATQFIHYDKLSEFVASLDPPLGIPVPNKIAVHNMDMPISNDDMIHCTDVLQALVTRYMGEIDGAKEHYDAAMDAITRKAKESFPVKYQKVSEGTTMDRLAQINSAILLQRCYRRWKKKKDRRLSNITIEEQIRPSISGRSVSVMHRHTRTNVNSTIHEVSKSMTDFAEIDNEPSQTPATNRFSRHSVMIEPQLSKSETLHEQSRTKSRSKSRGSIFTSPNRVSPISATDMEDGDTIDKENASTPTSRPLPVTPTSPVSSPVWNTETSDYDSFSLESKKSLSRDGVVEAKKDGRTSNLRHVSENPSFQSSLDDENSTSSGISSRSVEVLPDITM